MEDDAHGVHNYVADPRNVDVLISVNGALKRRHEALAIYERLMEYHV